MKGIWAKKNILRIEYSKFCKRYGGINSDACLNKRFSKQVSARAFVLMSGHALDRKGPQRLVLNTGLLNQSWRKCA